MRKKSLLNFELKSQGLKKSFFVGTVFSRRKLKKGAIYEPDSHLKKNTPWKNYLIFDRNIKRCNIHSSFLTYKWWYNNTKTHKNKKEQFKSKKLLNEIHLYFDVNKTH